MLGSQSLAGAQQQGVVSSVKRVQPCTARLHGSFSSRPQHCSHMASSFCSGAPLFSRPNCHVHRDSRCQRGSRLVVKADTDFYDVLGVPRSADKKAIKQVRTCTPILTKSCHCCVSLQLLGAHFLLSKPLS